MTGEPRAGDDRAMLLHGIALFRELPPGELARLAAIARGLELAAGELLFAGGDAGEELYVVVDGELAVTQGGREIARVGAGEVIGELAVLDAQPRSADARALCACRLISIHAGDLGELLDRHPALGRSLLRMLAARLRDAGSHQERVDQLIRAHRERGHAVAQIDPLGLRRVDAHQELALAHHGLEPRQLDHFFSFTLGRAPVRMRLRHILEHLEAVYGGAVGVQYMHIDDLGIQEWLRVRLEDPAHQAELSRAAQLAILAKLTDAEIFESFLQRTFTRAQRFSLEGSETLVPLLDQAIERAGELGVEEVVLGMAHRGRLNVLVNVMGKPPSAVFREFEGEETAEDVDDVKYHMGFDAVRRTACGAEVRLSLCFNPSHLEFVNAVVLGRARARQDAAGGEARSAHDRVLPVVVHGDAAFAGQGIVQELFNLSELAGYRTGGALHVVLNNQIGFTTPPEQGRSTQYATDVARMLQVPIFHVNGERPEAVDRVVRLALDFRRVFHRDVVIDMYGYRRRGHNERDEPAFTQPLLQRAIDRKEPVRASYAENVVGLGKVTRAEVDAIARASQERLERELARRGEGFEASPGPGPRVASPTGVPAERLADLLRRLSEIPPGFQPHEKVARTMAARRAMADGTRRVDWAAGEALAIATLALEGHPVRLSGQDSERGTFGHRHAVLHDARSGATHVPLRHLGGPQASVDVVNSPLSEAAVLGFEMGYSLDRAGALVIWEAQFGDFANAAQVVIDQFLVASRAKWGQSCGLCLFLPHGFEGQGPEHSSARLERFLQLCAADNLRVVSLTTAAQLFHALRAQAGAAAPRPLVVMSPKRLLQHPAASSSLDDLARGSFQPVLPDDRDPAGTRRVLLCGGQLHQQLAAERAGRALEGVALVRIEQYYPFPAGELHATLAPYGRDVELVWAQEEPVNMGAHAYLAPRLDALLGRRVVVVARPEAASPATGSHALHERQHRRLLDEALDAR